MIRKLEFCFYICKDIFKLKDYIKNLGEHYVNPNQCLECNMCEAYKHISFVNLEMEDADCASIIIDIDSPIIEISLESMFINIISVWLVLPDQI